MINKEEMRNLLRVEKPWCFMTFVVVFLIFIMFKIDCINYKIDNVQKDISTIKSVLPTQPAEKK